MELFNQDPFTVLYSLPMVLAAAINGFAKIYTMVIKRQVFGTSEDSFSLSLGNVLGMPLLIILLRLFQFEDRYKNLVLFYPFLLLLSSLLIPCMIIARNGQLTASLLDKVKACIPKLDCLKPRANSITPQP